MTTSTAHRAYALLMASLTCMMLPLASAGTVATPREQLTFKFDFNNITRDTTSNNGGYGLGTVGLDKNISLAMTTSLGTIAPKATVTTAGAVATQNYNGGGRVTQTPGNSDGSSGINLTPNRTIAYETFLVNNNFVFTETAVTCTPSILRDRFTLSFADFLVTNVSFDYEIFPDAICQKGSGCGPGMSFRAGSDAFNALSFLSFLDWPSEVSIDNLIITGCVTAVDGKCAPSKVLEPATLTLFGLGLIGVAAVRRRKLAARQA
ncbi:MAG: PEP-CTERM sorting domain-containing protein [Herminiimonas sp.]|nr:PEP-CTERM sorting domain-containing protein [Herminiimonas sp.]